MCIRDRCSFLDEKGCICNLSVVYVARDLDRIPAVKLEDMELFCVTRKMEALERRLSVVEAVNLDPLTAKLDYLSERLDTHQRVMAVAVDKVSTAVMSTEHVEDQSSADTAVKDTGAAVVVDGQLLPVPTTELVTKAEASDFATVLSKSRAHKQQNTPVTPGRAHKQHNTPHEVRPAFRLRGAKDLGNTRGTIRTVPRKSVLAAFVGRLHIDTTEEELSSFLTSEGMKGIVCKKLKPKDGQIFRTAAFYVTCCLESKELFYDECRWPDGVELRDWVYK